MIFFVFLSCPSLSSFVFLSVHFAFIGVAAVLKENLQGVLCENGTTRLDYGTAVNSMHGRHVLKAATTI